MLDKELLGGGGGEIEKDIRTRESGCSYSISHNNPVKAGTLVTITFTPNSGYTANNASYSLYDATGNVIAWEKITIGQSQIIGSFIMPAKPVNISCTMNLIPTYSISVNSPNAIVSLSKTSGIQAGEVISVSITPNSGYSFTSISSSPSVSFSGSGTNRTFTMPASNVRITVTCTLYQWTITVGSLYYEGSNYYGVNNVQGSVIKVFGSISPNINDTSIFSQIFTGFAANWIMTGNTTRTVYIKEKNKQYSGVYGEEAMFTSSDVGKTYHIQFR